MKASTPTKSSSMKNFPKIVLGSQKLRKKIKAKCKELKNKKNLHKKYRLVCEKCNGRFPTWWDIREHWKSSGHKEPEECRWCRKKTYALQSHLCKEHWNLACMCAYCGQLFMFQEGLQEHKRRHNGSEYRCYLCGKRQKNEETLRNHIIKHYIYERYGCNICEKRFKKKINVERHLKWIHFVCQYCGNTCENKGDLLEHQKTHDDLKCVLCKKVFSQKNRLKYHYQLRHGHQDFYKCSLCFQRFSMKSRLLEHLKLKHKGYAKISCEICDMPFLYWSQYLLHFEKIHVKPQEKFFCSFCDFSTNIRCKLQWHVEKTSGDGFSCKVCQLKLQCKSKFDEHMKTHNEKIGYNCDHCDKIYATADILKHHVTVSHQEVVISSQKGHPCLVSGCLKFYTSRNSLSRHMRRNHTEANVSGSMGQFCADNTVECRLPLTIEKSSNLQRRESSASIPTQSCPVKADSLTKKSTTKKGFEEVVVSDNMSVVSSSETSVDQLGVGSDLIEVDVYFCDICCKFWFTGDRQFRKHMTSHSKQVWDDECGECDEILESPEDAVRHYVEEHFKAEYLRY